MPYIHSVPLQVAVLPDGGRSSMLADRSSPIEVHRSRWRCCPPVRCTPGVLLYTNHNRATLAKTTPAVTLT